METKTLHELSLDFSGATQLERLQNLVAYLFKGAPVNLKSVTWDYFIKQFVVKYYNREIGFDSIDIFKTFLMEEVMNYSRFMEKYNLQLYDDVIAGGFNLTETSARTVDEDRKRNLGIDSNENNTGSATQKDGKTYVESGVNNIEDKGTSTASTKDAITDNTVQDGTTTGKETTVNTDDGTNTTTTKNTGTVDVDVTGTENTARNNTTKNTGTVDRDITGTENTARNNTTTEEGASDSKTTSSGYDRTLNSDTPQSIVNAATTGNPTDINWKYATKLQDDIQNGTTDTDSHDERSTVSNGSDNLTLDKNEKTTDDRTETSTGSDILTLDRNEKTTDNRVATVTGSNKNNGTQDVDSTGSSKVTTDYTRDGKSDTETTLEQTSKRTDTKSGSEDKEGTTTSTLNKVSSRNDNETQNLDKTETLNRTWAKLTPFEGNVSLYDFVVKNINDPIKIVVDGMEVLFMSMYVSPDRLAPLGWMERDGCVAKL